MTGHPVAKALRLLSVLALIAPTAACSPHIERLSLSDPRLPLEARRALADAEDEVSIAAAGRDDAQSNLEEALDFRRYVERHVNTRWPSGSGSAAARQRLDAMVEARIRLAHLDVEAAETRIVLANAMLVRARAETAVRHDLASYDLEPIVAVAEEARADLDRAVQRIEQQRVAVDEATTAWWEAYGAYLAGGGDNSILWSWDIEN